MSRGRGGSAEAFPGCGPANTSAATALALGVALMSGCASSVTNQGSPSVTVATATRTRAGCPESVHLPRPPLEGEITKVASLTGVTKVPPQYPSIAREGGFQGTVVMAVLVCEHGRVVDARVVKSNPMLDVAALDAVYQWRFEPAQVNGAPGPIWVEVPMRFVLH